MRKWPNRLGKLASATLLSMGPEIKDLVAFIIMIPRRPMEPQVLWLTLLLRVAVAASLASILSRFGAFQRMLMREDRTLVQRVKLALMCSALYGSSVLFRVLNPAKYDAVDLGL